MIPADALLKLIHRFKVTKKSHGAGGPSGLLAATPDPQGTADAGTPNAGPEEQARKILVDNPQISGSTYFNILKSQGLKIVQEARLVREGAKGIPKGKYDSCVDQTKAKGKVDNSYAVCNWSMGRKYGEAIKRKPSREADAASGNTASVRTGTRDLSQENNTRIKILSARFLESAARDNGVGPTKFRVVLIQEGLGNFKDAYYYTKASLHTAMPIFEGKKIYADHPTTLDEQTRPERSVRDILGYFENVQYVETEEGQGQLEADVCTLPEEEFRWARSLMTHSVDYAKKYPDKEFVGLSINASGEAEPAPIDSLLESEDVSEPAKVKLNKAKTEGIETVKLVKAIKEAISCDLVTEAGAGGKVLEMIEKEKHMAKAKNVKESDKKDVAPAKGGGDKDPSKLHAESEGDKAPPEAPAKKGGEHDDEDKDKALIAKMLKDHLGDEESSSEEIMKMAKEMYEGYKELGYEAEEAMKCAGHSMKLAKHLASKETKENAENESKEEDKTEAVPPVPEDKKDAAPDKDDGDKKEESHKEGESDDDSKKESNALIAAKAENAALKEQLKTIEIQKHLETVLTESKLPRSVTTMFRESIGTPKSAKQIDDSFKIFVEAYKAGQGSETDSLPFVVSTEKKTSSGKKSLDFSDCTN